MRKFDAYGLDGEGNPVDEPDPAHSPEVCINTIGGDKQCRWEYLRPARHVLVLLRDRLRGALARVETLLES